MRIKRFFAVFTMALAALATMTSCRESAGYEKFLNDNFAKGKVSNELLKEASPGAASV